eukprot:NODE_4530_length_1051_cov_54.858836_g4328_i0.p1 GENE.NODE_4530_length_1051_cov_54.858836_g4328_i0~~NODE_4530_length_1051_cov_54.858836_g4328_i0.p1  ORF type:complete len:278 (+),score=88.19 NODE_4530_length_1051_cov_54.858836_g4328_i0:33-866(+)
MMKVIALCALLAVVSAQYNVQFNNQVAGGSDGGDKKSMTCYLIGVGDDMPYEYLNTTTESLTGFGLKVIDAAAKAGGFCVKYTTFQSYSECAAQGASGQPFPYTIGTFLSNSAVTGCSGMWGIKARQMALDFTDNYTTPATAHVWHLSATTGIDTAMAGTGSSVTIGFVSGTATNENMLRAAYPNALFTASSFSTSAAAEAALSGGSIQGYFKDRTAVASTSSFGSVNIAGEQIGIRPTSTVFKAAFNAGLMKIRQNGVYAQLCAQAKVMTPTIRCN